VQEEVSLTPTATVLVDLHTAGAVNASEGPSSSTAMGQHNRFIDFSKRITPQNQ